MTQPSAHPSNKQLIERWQNVLRVLESLSPHERRKHFRMSDWGEKTACGTVACVAGHCSLDPWFRRRGFKSYYDDCGMLQIANPIAQNNFDYEAPFYKLAKVFFDPVGAQRVFLDASGYTDAVRRTKAHIKELQSSSDPSTIQEPQS